LDYRALQNPGSPFAFRTAAPSSLWQGFTARRHRLNQFPDLLQLMSTPKTARIALERSIHISATFSWPSEENDSGAIHAFPGAVLTAY
jgi:hypothetical protein